MSRPVHFNRRRQRGAAAVEFAVTILIFLSLTIGVIEFARFTFHWSTAIEATRLGARVAIVCDQGDSIVKARMRDMLPLLEDADITVTYPAGGCSASSCDPVTVHLENVTIPLIIPIIPISLQLPPLHTSLTAESLSSSDNYLCD